MSLLAYLLLSQNAACDLDNAACIARIIICADLLRVVFRKYGAADHGLAGMPRLVEGVNRALHRRDRRRHQRRQPDQPDLLFNRNLHHACDRHVTPEVDDLISVVLKDDLDDVLADVMDVAFDRREDDLSLRRAAP